MARRRGQQPAPRWLVWRWLKWWPHLAIPFGVLFVETFLHLGILGNDYERARINQHMKALQQEVLDLNARRAELEAMGRIQQTAVQLGLVEPEPNQVEVLVVERPHGPVLAEQPFSMARMESTMGPGAPAP